MRRALVRGGLPLALARPLALPLSRSVQAYPPALPPLPLAVPPSRRVEEEEGAPVFTLTLEAEQLGRLRARQQSATSDEEAARF